MTQLRLVPVLADGGDVEQAGLLESAIFSVPGGLIVWTRNVDGIIAKPVDLTHSRRLLTEQKPIDRFLEVGQEASAMATCAHCPRN